MKTTIHAWRAMILSTVLSFAAATETLAVSIAWDGGRPAEGGNSYRFSALVPADDFVLADEASLGWIRFWGVGGTTEVSGPLPEFFSGMISWAIYQDDNGTVGPLMMTGEDDAPGVTATGLFDGFDGEIHQIDVALGSVHVPAGHYWLAMHEGPWGSAFDGTDVWWVESTMQQGHEQRFSAELDSPTGPFEPSTGDVAFQLFAIPEPATATLLLAGLTFVALHIWRRKCTASKFRRWLYRSEIRIRLTPSAPSLRSATTKSYDGRLVRRGYDGRGVRPTKMRARNNKSRGSTTTQRRPQPNAIGGRPESVGVTKSYIGRSPRIQGDHRLISTQEIAHQITIFRQLAPNGFP